jgi:hypothetical protein
LILQQGPGNVPVDILARMDLTANTNNNNIAAALLSDLLSEPVCPSIDQTVKHFSLNVKQEAVVRAVLEHYSLTKQGMNPEQLKMAVLGEPGVGKSVVASAISWHFERHGNADWLVVAAFTGIIFFSLFFSFYCLFTHLT